MNTDTEYEYPMSAISGSEEYKLLIIWAKHCNFFQKCTMKPLTAWTIMYTSYTIEYSSWKQIPDNRDVNTMLV